MDRDLSLKFCKALSNMEGKNYIQSLIAFGAAPTIANKKPSSLMTFSFDGKNTASLWMQYGTEICDFFVIDYFEIKNKDNCIIVLLYNKRMLKIYINRTQNRDFMQKLGYSKLDDIQKILLVLRRRFETVCPHEIGIFLGIPLEDVEGFIEHNGKNCIMCRYWNVYKNPKRAEQLFRAYDTARSDMAEFVVGLNTIN